MLSEIESTFDYIIVGGGTAGCVLANRLSADPSYRVLLIEAGPAFDPGQAPEAIRDRGVRSLMMRQYFWPGLMARDGVRPKAVLQARVLGGGSMINGMHAQRGTAEDYDEWRQYGLTGWGWDDVLPFFKRIESDTDFISDSHGTTGPVQIRRVKEESWSNLSFAIRTAMEQRGVPRVEDVTATDGDCVGPVPLGNTDQRRVSTADDYLPAQVRRRSNLRILTLSTVVRILISGRKAHGVALADGKSIRGANVILSAGAIHSPVLLIRSGIGPAAHLREYGIEVLCDRPGVGQNLRLHPIVTVTSHLKRDGRQHDTSVRPPAPMMVRYSSKVPGCQPTDMMINVWERNPAPLLHDPMNRQLANTMVILNKSYSVGQIRLSARDSSHPIDVRAHLLEDQRDLDRMVQSFLMLREVLSSAPLRSLVYNSFVANLSLGLAPDPLTKRLLADTAFARLISSAGALACDYLPGVRGRIARLAGQDIHKVSSDPKALEAFMRTVTTVGGHPAGTCRMGDVNDRNAVLGPDLRVISTENLRVVDASIFPTLMRSGTNLPVIMAAEKAADMIIEERATDSRAAASRTSGANPNGQILAYDIAKARHARQSPAKGT